MNDSFFQLLKMLMPEKFDPGVIWSAVSLYPLCDVLWSPLTQETLLPLGRVGLNVCNVEPSDGATLY